MSNNITVVVAAGNDYSDIAYTRSLLSSRNDIIVVGAGPAGLTAALYALRASKSVLVIEQSTFGGQVTFSPKIENYPGIPEMSGNEFADKLLVLIRLHLMRALMPLTAPYDTVKSEMDVHTEAHILKALYIFVTHNASDKKSVGILLCKLLQPRYYREDEKRNYRACKEYHR